MIATQAAVRVVTAEEARRFRIAQIRERSLRYEGTVASDVRFLLSIIDEAPTTHVR